LLIINHFLLFLDDKAIKTDRLSRKER